jgi:hypothetical protein
MSSLRYFEFDSTYRNRTQFPSPASFVIDIAQSGQKSRENALDPVSNASPILEWNNSFQETVAANNIPNITMISVPSSGEGLINNTTFQIKVPDIPPGTGGFRQVSGFYNGASIYITVGGTVYSRRIISYNYINLTTAIISLDSPMEDAAFAASVTATISNPTPIPTNTPTPVAPPSITPIIQFFIPGGAGIDNYYVNYYIQVLANPTSGVSAQTARITSYNGLTRLATLSSATTQDWASDTFANANFAIRKALPVSTGAIYGINSNGTALQLDVSELGNTPSGTYSNSALRIVQISTGSGNQPSAANGFSALSYPPNPPFQEEAVISNFVSGVGIFSNVVNTGSSSTFNLGTTPNTFNYIGCLVTNTSIAFPHSTGVIASATFNSNTMMYTYTISSWSNGTPTNGNNWVICTAFINYTMSNPSAGLAFSTNPPLVNIAGTTYPTYEIEQFSRENYTPFIYTGSIVSSQQEVCYEIELLNLVLPNTLLQSGRGGRAIFYPYLYVELQQISASAGHQRGIMYSNNPNSYKMLFRALVNDTSTPAASPFIRIDGDGMTHVVKFKPNDSFKFGVYMSDGTLFRTVATDTTPPTEPNPMVQISACFSFKRMKNSI